MASSEWIRTFVAVYRSGSVSKGASHRGLTQPAASQHLAALERAVGQPLFARRPDGVEPTQRGREFYASVAEAMDSIEPVLRGLDAGAVRSSEPSLRLGSSPEYFAAEILPQLTHTSHDVTASFGTDAELISLLERGELDLIVISSSPARRAISAIPIGVKRFVLVASPPMLSDQVPANLVELGDWLTKQPWTSYSHELPLTRRFWLSVLKRPFAARTHLVAPDLRAVLHAVELGIGVSMLPTFVCRDALEQDRIREVFPISHLAAEEPWFACLRQSDLNRASINDFITRLAAAGQS